MYDDLIDVGLDFGGRHIRASYRLGKHIISVPASNAEAFWIPPMVTLAAPNGGIAVSVLKLLLFSDQMIHYGMNARQQKPQPIFMDMLEQINESIASYAGYDVGRLFLGIPDWYPNVGRERLKMAAQAAGYEEVHLISESYAAVMGYLEDYPDEGPSKLLVYSLGFSGFEAQIIEIKEDSSIAVLAQHSQNVQGRSPINAVLSGKDLDLYLLQQVFKAAQQNGIPISPQIVQTNWAHLHHMIEQVKMSLSVEPNVIMQFPYELMPTDRPLAMQFSRQILERVLFPNVVEPSERIIEGLLAETNLTTDDIHHVLLVGGSTRIPAVQSNLKVIFGDKLIQPREDIISRGAASVALYIDNKDDDFGTLVAEQDSMTDIPEAMSDISVAPDGLATINSIEDTDNVAVTPIDDSGRIVPLDTADTEQTERNKFLETNAIKNQGTDTKNKGVNSPPIIQNNSTTKNTGAHKPVDIDESNTAESSHIKTFIREVESVIQQQEYSQAQDMLDQAEEEIKQLRMRLDSLWGLG